MITKFEAAQRQLATAIQLFFEERDAVSIYTLAHAARILLADLCKSKGIKHTLEDVSVVSGLELPDIYGHLAMPANFFKHADRDPESVFMDFDEKELDGLLLIACKDTLAYSRRMEVDPAREVLLYWHWYAAANINKVRIDSAHGLDQLFPGFRKLDRNSMRRLGRSVLQDTEKMDALVKAMPTRRSGR